MIKNRSVMIIVMMCVFCLTACGSGSSSKEDKVTLTFDGNATTGYTWQVDDDSVNLHSDKRC